MKNLITKEEKDRIDSICIQYHIENYTINPNGSIDVNGDVSLSQINLTKLPLVFGNVTGQFNCSGNGLTTLDGSPRTIGGNFSCYANVLTTLEGSPIKIGGYYHCGFNQLISTYCGDDDIETCEEFLCMFNKLPDLIMDNEIHMVTIVKYQRPFMIWNEDLTLNEENFNDLIADIKDGLE